MTNFEKLRQIDTNTFNRQLYGWMANLVTHDEIVEEQDALNFLNEEYDPFYEDAFCMPVEYLKSIMEAYEDDVCNASPEYIKGVRDLREAIERCIS